MNEGMNRLIMKNRPKLVLAGFFGNNNIGDEAILTAQIENLRNNFELIVLSSNPKETIEKHKIRSSRFPSIRRFNHLINYFIIISKSNGLIIGGGGFLANRLQPFSIYNWLIMILLAKLFRKKVVLFSIGAGPFTTGIHRSLIKSVLEKVDYMLPRDITSALYLKQIIGEKVPIHMTADISFLISDVPVTTIAKPATHPFILFILCSRFHSEIFFKEANSNIKYNNYLKAIVKIADFVVDSLNSTPVFLPFYVGDLDFYKEIQQSMKNSRASKLLRYTPEISEILSIIRQAEVVIASRYHGVLLSFIAETPVLPIVYHHKTFDLVKGQSIPYQQIGINIEWPDVDIDVEETKRDLIELLHNKQKYSNIAKNRKYILKKKAEKNIIIIKKIF